MGSHICPFRCDPEVCVIGLDLGVLDGLHRVRDVGVVDDRTVPDGNSLSA